MNILWRTLGIHDEDFDEAGAVRNDLLITSHQCFQR